MKRIVYYLSLVVVLGMALVSFWVYQKYFKEEKPTFLSFKVEKGNIQEMIKVRGEVAPQKDFNLEFPFSGIVESVLVREGQLVEGETPLMKLETTDFELVMKQSQAQASQADAGVESAQAQLLVYRAALETQEAKFNELVRGTRSEELKLANTKTINAQKALKDSERSLAASQEKAIIDLQNLYINVDDLLHDAYIKADKRFLDYFIDLREVSPTNLSGQKTLANNALNSFQAELDALPSDQAGLDQAGLDQAMARGVAHLTVYRDFLQFLNEALDTAMPNISQTTYSTYKTNLNIGRTNLQAALTAIDTEQRAIVAQKIINQNALASAESNVTIFRNALSSAEDELLLKQAGSTSGELLATRAQVRGAQANVALGEAQLKQARANLQNYQVQIPIIQEKIKKSTLYSPEATIVTKVWLEKQELARPGQIAIALQTADHEIRADISELEIGKLKQGDDNKVDVRLDAFPQMGLQGKVISIEPKEIIKEGDKYYPIKVFLFPHDLEIRSGMSADLAIMISAKDSVLKVPELVIYKKDDKKFVTILYGREQKEIEIETGISDGTFIEITKGLREGQTVILKVD